MNAFLTLAEGITLKCFIFPLFLEHRLLRFTFTLSFLLLPKNFIHICLTRSLKAIVNLLSILRKLFLLFQTLQYFMQLSNGVTLDIVDIQSREKRNKLRIYGFHLMLIFQ